MIAFFDVNVSDDVKSFEWLALVLLQGLVLASSSVILRYLLITPAALADKRMYEFPGAKMGHDPSTG